MTTFRPLVMLLLLVAAAPFASAASRPRIDVDLDVDADLQVVARAAARADADLSYEWDWGDGEASAGAHARHAYRAAGEYDVTLTVRDEDTGRCWAERRTLVVEASRAQREESGKDEDERAERGSRQREASASVSVGGGRRDVSLDASVRVSRTRGGEASTGPDETEASLYARSGSPSSHESPGAGLALVLPALAGLAMALRRRG